MSMPVLAIGPGVTDSKDHDDFESISPVNPISSWSPHDTSITTTTPTATARTIANGSANGNGNGSGNGDLPTGAEIYGLIAVLGTYLAFTVYLVWAICPSEWLDQVGWSWYPSKDWALIVPCYLMLVVLLAYFTYAALSAYLTPSFDSPDLITDRYCNIPPRAHGADVYYWKLADPRTIPEAVDLPLDLVNRVLYPPRKRR